MPRKYELTEQEAQMAFNQVQSHVAALKNWIASAVESNDHSYAKSLTIELRQYERLFAKLNVEAHRMIDRATATN
jgi:hypothetical protein